MKRLNFGNRSRNGHAVSGVVECVSISRLVDYFQYAIVNLQLFGLGTGAIANLALLVSLSSHCTHSGADKGVL
jgi:hypothetical protein